MKPILYKANETDFRTLGMGVLADELGTLVTEERNGQFYLEMKYPINGKHFKELKVDRVIKADASNDLKNQQFKIIRISKPAKGVVTVYADHVSNHTADLQLKVNADYSGDADTALRQWSSYIVGSHPFTTFSNVTTVGQGQWDIKDVDNARQALGGVQGSILDTYGGEYRFDNYRISLLSNRGVDNGLPIMYGKNLVDLEQEEEIATVYTSIYPYAEFTPEREEDQEGDVEPVIITLPEHYIDSEHVDKYARRKILKVDFSSEEIETEEQLRTRAERYIRENDVGVPKINLRVKFIDLAKTIDYKDRALVEEINLCDWVTVHFPELGIQQRAKIIKTVWNVGLDRYEEIEIGDTRSNLTDSIDVIVDGKIEEVEKDITHIRNHANGKNRVFRGTIEPSPDMYDLQVGDLWFRPIGDGEMEMYQWDGEVWVLVVTTGVNHEIERRLEEARGIAEDARDNTEALKIEADSILAGLGVEGIQDTHQDIVDQIRAGVGDRIDGLVASKVDANSTQYQTLIQRHDLYSRVIGSTETGISNNVSRIVQSSGIIQTEVSGIIGGLEGDVDTLSTQVTQLAGSWALRITSNDELVSAINASSNGVYIQGKNIVLDGNTIVDGSFTVTNSMLANDISANKINTGTLNAANVNIINLTVDNISGFTSSFFRTNWNQAYSSVSITGDSVGMIHSNTIRDNGYAFELRNNEVRIGVPTYIYDTLDMRANDIVFGRDMSISANTNPGNWLYIKGASGNIAEFGGSVQIRVPLQTHSTMQVGGNIAMDGNHIYFNPSANMYAPATDELQINIRGNRRVLYRNADINFYNDLNMRGYTITGQSDERLKRDITDTGYNSLEILKQTRFVGFNWVDEELNAETGRQMGVLAQDTPHLHIYDQETDEWSIDTGKQIMVNSHAIQQLANEKDAEIAELKERLEVLENGS